MAQTITGERLCAAERISYAPKAVWIFDHCDVRWQPQGLLVGAVGSVGGGSAVVAARPNVCWVIRCVFLGTPGAGSLELSAIQSSC